MKHTHYAGTMILLGTHDGLEEAWMRLAFEAAGGRCAAAALPEPELAERVAGSAGAAAWQSTRPWCPPCFPSNKNWELYGNYIGLNIYVFAEPYMLLLPAKNK